MSNTADELRAGEAAHEAIRMFALTCGESAPPTAWASAPQEVKDSVMAAVDAIVADPAIAVADCHGVWVKELAGAGWCYGSYSDQLQDHPLALHYDNLQPSQKHKAELLLHIVKAVLNI